jgi:hypothetical protein
MLSAEKKAIGDVKKYVSEFSRIENRIHSINQSCEDIRMGLEEFEVAMSNNIRGLKMKLCKRYCCSQ